MPAPDEPLNDVETATAYILEASRHELLPAGRPLFATETIAVLARSLEDFASAANVVYASERREMAARYEEQAERRHPSGRRVHTRHEAKELRDKAAQDLAKASAADAAALAASGAPDLDSARAAVSYIVDLTFDSDDEAQRVYDRARAVGDRVHAIRRKYYRGFYVRGRAAQTRQPRGGIMPLALFDRHELGGDPLTRSTETGAASTIASAVELLVRWGLAGDERANLPAEEVALEAIRGVRRGEQTTAPGTIAAVLRRDHEDIFDEIDWESEGDHTLGHISQMASRVHRVFDEFGAPTQAGTVEVTSERYRLSGHIDFLSESTLWDLKVSERKPTAADVLQLLLYWLIARDDPELGSRVTYIGLINPRLGAVWRAEVASVPEDVLTAVEAAGMAHPGEFGG